eukprot:TRINITY_DN377_c0_g2_i3.p2 TRINITY_DN377_c0_g2~~TRINITY_DN377_c0_g2_i3.p2  ORF type:complete len:153 (+),score=14.26 TRINITY_DN377_c0_g2_i3:2223-2681(+)
MGPRRSNRGTRKGRGGKVGWGCTLDAMDSLEVSVACDGCLDVWGKHDDGGCPLRLDACITCGAEVGGSHVKGCLRLLELAILERTYDVGGETAKEVCQRLGLTPNKSLHGRLSGDLWLMAKKVRSGRFGVKKNADGAVTGLTLVSRRMGVYT